MLQRALQDSLKRMSALSSEGSVQARKPILAPQACVHMTVQPSCPAGQRDETAADRVL